jgi:hypothetical protein
MITLQSIIEECEVVLQKLDVLHELVHMCYFQGLDEYRPRTFVELRCYFPDFIYKFQCRQCLNDGVCRYGSYQGFQCAMFFMLHSQNVIMVDRRINYDYITEENITMVDFPNLLLIAALKGVNIAFVSPMTTHNLRQHLYDLFIDQSA